MSKGAGPLFTGVPLRIGPRGADAVVLGVDPGAASGAAIVRPDESIVMSGFVGQREATLRRDFVLTALEEAQHLGCELLVVGEKWTAGGPFSSPRSMQGLGAQWGRWQEQLDLFAPFLPASRVSRAYPQTWRSCLRVGGSQHMEKMRAFAFNKYPGRYLFKDMWNEDELQALGLALYGLRRVKRPRKLPPLWHSKARAEVKP